MAWKSSPPSTLTLWKITNISANSTIPTSSEPKMSSANPARYARCARTRDASTTRYGVDQPPRSGATVVVTTSATLHHQLLAAGIGEHPSHKASHAEPEQLHTDHSERVRSGHLA